ncbi:MAG TPA: class I SAM-dependent RNA methyltransferase [Longimicrobiales bacterium]|nr:class I SAM-dependent RNA methyltransferase [Longimicrobiales bacterium]
MSAELELHIDSIAAGGAGVGRDSDGRAVFVHRTAPGERVAVRITTARKRWARATLLRVLEPSPLRRDAPCRFYARCGGCTLEHLAYEAQLAAKAGIVADALARIGGIAVEPPTVVASPRQLRYRNRMSFTLVRLQDGTVRAGFHELERPDRVLDIDESCLMPEETIAAVWGEVRRHWGSGASRLPSGTRLRLTLRATADGRTSLLVQGGFSAGRPDELLARVASLDAIWHQPQPEEAPVLLGGSAALKEVWDGEDLSLGGAVFLQVNRGAAALLDEYVLELAGDVSGRIVVDAYCGVGLHARRLVRRGARVSGIELDAQAVREAQRGVPDAAFTAARVEDALPAVLPADLVVLNPPRAGVAEDVITALLGTPPGRIIYVSCDPATLARDLKRLAQGYELRSIRCFDLFPQTAHVESVVELTCSTT